MNNLDFAPVSDFLLIDPIAANMTEGGLALPDSVEISVPKGRVVKCGPGRVSEEGAEMPMPVSVGDVVYLQFVYHQPMPFKVGGKDYLIVRARDLVGKVESQTAIGTDNLSVTGNLETETAEELSA